MIHHPLAPGKLRVMRRTVEQIRRVPTLCLNPIGGLVPSARPSSGGWMPFQRYTALHLKPLRDSTVSFSSDATELWSCHIAGASRVRLSALFSPCCTHAVCFQLARFACSSSCLSAPACWTVPRPRPSPPSAVAATAGRRLIDLACHARPSPSRWPHAERQRAQLRRALESAHIGTRDAAGRAERAAVPMSLGYWRCGDPLLARPAIRDRRTGCWEAIGSAVLGSACARLASKRVVCGLPTRGSSAGCMPMRASYGAGRSSLALR